jgi:hypothetical protein
VRLRELARQHRMICQTGISAEIVGATRELSAWKRDDGSIAIPDRDLGTIGARHLHAQTKAYLMNNGAVIPNRMPNAHYLCWQGEHGIVSHCCHMNAVWLSADICRNAPNFMPATIDTRLPHFADEFYVPAVEDNMTFIEISGPDKASAQFKVDFDFFAAKCWAQTGFSEKYMPYFRKPSVTPTHPQKEFLADDVIAEQAQQVGDLLWSVRPPAWMAKIQQIPVEAT